MAKYRIRIFKGQIQGIEAVTFAFYHMNEGICSNPGWEQVYRLLAVYGGKFPGMLASIFFHENNAHEIFCVDHQVLFQELNGICNHVKHLANEGEYGCRIFEYIWNWVFEVKKEARKIEVNVMGEQHIIPPIVIRPVGIQCKCRA